MVKVILETALAGTQGTWAPGEEYECSALEAKRLIAKGLAKPTKTRRTKKSEGNKVKDEE